MSLGYGSVNERTMCMHFVVTVVVVQYHSGLMTVIPPGAQECTQCPCKEKASKVTGSTPGSSGKSSAAEREVQIAG